MTILREARPDTRCADHSTDRIEVPVQLALPELAETKREITEPRSANHALTNYLRVVGIAEHDLTASLLLDEFKSLPDILAASWWRLSSVGGERVADCLHAGRQLAQAALLQTVERGPLVPRSRELIDFLQFEIGFMHHERLLAIYVDTRRRLIRIEHIADGGIGEIAIDNRAIIARGLSLGASGFILVHNHPSGMPKPSQPDLAITAKLRALGAALDLHLLDHLIIARGRTASIEDYWREVRWKDAAQSASGS